MDGDLDNVVELPWQEAQEQIDSCQYLFAEDVKEISELAFKFKLVEAKPQPPIVDPGDFTLLALLKLGGRPIEHDQTCRVFDVVFSPNGLICYLVMNESYAVPPKAPEEFTGRLCRTYSASLFQELILKTTYASDEYPGPLQHFEFVCMNHIIHVISTLTPRVSVRTRVLHKAGSIALGGSWAH